MYFFFVHPLIYIPIH